MERKKMIAKMTAGLVEEDKFDMKKENIVKLKNNLEEAVNIFCYGYVVYAILRSNNQNKSWNCQIR